MTISSEDMMKAARSVFSRATEALDALNGWLDDSFIQAVLLLSSCSGKVIISGMGKSGHIGHKMAATMSSTGTPAFFIHPGEASHGDLGMVQKNDVLILLSNSGETKELKDLIHFSRRFSIPLIAIVRRKASMLVQAADVSLILPDIPEASDINAPTTSTTMMLVLGDALSTALLENKGFTSKDFSILHPGGKLGSAFLTVESLMRKGDQIPKVYLDTPIHQLLVEMSCKMIGSTAVFSRDEVLKGVITDGDLRRYLTRHIVSKKAEDIMTSTPITISSKRLAKEALAIMEKRGITSIFVLDQQKVEGVIHFHDILKAGVI